MILMIKYYDLIFTVEGPPYVIRDMYLRVDGNDVRVFDVSNGRMNTSSKLNRITKRDLEQMIKESEEVSTSGS